MGNGHGIARSPLCQLRHSLSSRSIAIIIMMTIESCAHMGDLTRKFRAHAYTSVWLERLKRRAKLQAMGCSHGAGQARKHARDRDGMDRKVRMRLRTEDVIGRAEGRRLLESRGTHSDPRASLCWARSNNMHFTGDFQ